MHKGRRSRLSSIAPTQPQSSFKRLWQIPVLVAGVGLFLYGLYSFKKTAPVVPFKDHAHVIRLMIDQKKYTEALKQIANIENYFPEKEHQRELHLLAGDAFYMAQQEQPAVVEENYRKVIEHYDQAEKLGLDEHDSEYLPMQERWAQSLLAINETKEGLKKLEWVIEHNPARLSAHAREMVEAYLDLKEPNVNAAIAVLNRVAHSNLNVDDRVWALSKKIELAIGDRGLDAALEEANRVLPQIAERNPAGILLTWIGRGYFIRGDIEKAREKLSQARGKFIVHNLDDGRAALLLGKIAQSKDENDTALKLYQEVVTSHAGTSIMAAARMGRAEIRSLNESPDEATLVDFDYVISLLTDAKFAKGKKKPEFLTKDMLRSVLVLRQQQAQQHERYKDSLTYLNLIARLGDDETVDIAQRTAITHEKLGNELEAEVAHASADEKQNLFEKALEHYDLAAKAYLRHSRLATLNIPVSSASLWHAAQLFDHAAEPDAAIDAYKKYIHDLPRDPHVSEAIHAIGQLYQSRAMFDKAIPFYMRNIRENPKSPATYLSTVQLARCYMAQGENQYGKAEEALLSIVQDNPNILPTANEFRISLFTLGELYYRTRQWASAILRLEEAITRYPDDPAIPRATFWLADSYRKSATEIQEVIKKDPQIENRDSLEQARQDRLRQSGLLFSRVINQLDPDPMHPLTLAPVEGNYLEFSYLYRADCMYDLADYSAAVKLYDAAATRFNQSVTTADAYVQIVNCYLALKEPAQAAAAAERARLLIKRIPDDAFKRGILGLDRKYYDKFFRMGRADVAENK